MKKSILVCVIVSALIASYALCVGLQHNAMGEFCIDPDAAKCELNYGYASGIWATWFLLAVLPSSGLVVLARFLLGRRNR